MMDIYGNTIDSVRNYNLDPKEIIAGLNGYYESDKRNGYITVIRNDLEGPAYFTAALYLSALIEWLREDHGIFYRPGLILDQVEAARSAAKMCCLRAHIKDEICKRGLWCGADEDVPALVDTLFKAYDECVERANKNRADAVKLSKEIRCVVNEKESAIENLKERIAELESEFKAVCDEDDIFRTRALKAEEEVKKLKEQLDKATADYQALSEENKKLKNKVLETEDLLHKSVDSVNKECKATGKQMIADYKKDLLQFIYKEYKDRIHRDEGVIAYNPPSVRNTVLKIISDYARCRTRVDILETRIKSIFDRCKANFTVDDYVLNGDPTTSFMLDCISSWIDSPAFESRGKIRAEIENYKLKLKDYILKDIRKHGYRYDGLETKSVEEIVDRIIQIATCPRNEWADSEIKNLRGQIDRLKGLINAMNEEVGDM